MIKKIQSKMDLLFNYENLDSMLFNQDEQIKGQIYKVDDRFFMYNGLSTETLNDYTEIGTTISGDVDAANLYLTNDTSLTDGNYLQLNYDFDPNEIESSIEVSSSISPYYYATYISDLEITGNFIPSGNWYFVFKAKVSSLSGTTTLGAEVFIRHDDGTETTLFNVVTDDLEVLEYQWFTIGTTQPSYSVLTTDKLGIRTFASTTRNLSTEISTFIGGSNGAYVNTPLQLRHDLLRDKNGNNKFLHVTLEEKEQIYTNKDSIQINSEAIIRGDSLSIDSANTYTDIVIDSLNIAIMDSLESNRVYIYESEIGYDGQSTISLPWELKATSTIFYENAPLRLSEWSGVGTTTLSLLFDTKKYEYAIIKR